MLKRLMGSLSYLILASVVVIAVASTTVAPSYRECALDYETRGTHLKSIHGIPGDVLLFVGCAGEFLQRNAAVLTAIAIILIAFSILALQRSTVRLWKAGERQIGVAEKAAETARLSAHAAVGAERAHLFVDIKAANLEQPFHRARLEEGQEPGIATPVEPPCVDYVLSNHGRTVALLKVVRHAITWEHVDGLRAYQPEAHGPLEVIAPHTDSKVISCRFRGDFTSRDARSIVTGKRALMFFGEAIFVDAFGHARGVRWRCRCTGGTFDLIGFQEYEPDHEEPGPAPV